jgi:hypothetical protein
MTLQFQKEIVGGLATFFLPWCLSRAELVAGHGLPGARLNPFLTLWEQKWYSSEYTDATQLSTSKMNPH